MILKLDLGAKIVWKNLTYLTKGYGNTGCGVFKQGVQN